jgi:hypothetical protein
MNLETRQRVERQIVRNLIRTASQHGFALVAVHDGEERVPTRTEREAMDAVFAVDESKILFRHPAEKKAHCAVIILGNDGWDCVADASMGERWDPVIEANATYADRFC